MVEGEIFVKIFIIFIVFSFEKNWVSLFFNVIIDMGDGSFYMFDWCFFKDICNLNDMVIV